MTKLIDFDVLYAPPERAHRVIIIVAVLLIALLCLLGLAVLGIGMYADRDELFKQPDTEDEKGVALATVVDGAAPQGWKLAFEETFDNNNNNWDLARY